MLSGQPSFSQSQRGPNGKKHNVLQEREREIFPWVEILRGVSYGCPMKGWLSKKNKDLNDNSVKNNNGMRTNFY